MISLVLFVLLSIAPPRYTLPFTIDPPKESARPALPVLRP